MPTLTEEAHLTSPGTALGTVAYMSPEQALGQELDARTDLFSLGIVLYEMATGRQAFPGSTTAAIFDGILHKAPTSPIRLNPECPVELERIINKALEKDRDIRYQVAAELRADLKRLKRDTDSGRSSAPAAGEAVATVTPGVVQPRKTQKWLALAAAGMVLLLGLAGWYFLRPKPQLLLAPVNPRPFTSMQGYEGRASFSPDGSQIAFDWNGKERNNWDIYIKMIGTENLLRLTNDPAAEYGPRWSPDGRQIAFIRSSDRGTAIYVISPLGGPERKLHDVKFEEGYSWSPDGKSLAVSDRSSEKSPSQIFLLSLESLQVKPLTSPPNGSPGDNMPAFSPDGRTVAF
ncbi:MAG TPA: protein kinase, partial [Candidatus Acidoferrum sp.]|nr:protein kinase [Candidatus Acidoferrum sp.]